MKQLGLVIAIAAVLAAAAALAVYLLAAPGPASPSGTDEAPGTTDIPRRIVSLSPGITEMLFALGLGDHVAGVTRYCDTPPETLYLPKVGGFMDPNLEMIVTLEPDLVLAPAEMDAYAEPLTHLGLNLRCVDHRTLDGVIESILTIGAICHADAEALALTRSIDAEFKTVAARVAESPRPGVLVVILRDYTEPRFTEVYVAGRDGFYDTLIQNARGTNVVTMASPAYPVLSREAILRMNPDIIIDLAALPDAAAHDPDTLRGHWDTLPELRAVAAGRVFVLQDSSLVRPGPRVGAALTRIARCIHPERFELEVSE